MNKTLIIILREYLSRVKKKSFIILTLLTPILIAAFYFILIWVMLKDDNKERTIAVVNNSTLEQPLKNDDFTKFDYLNSRLDEAKSDFIAKKKYYALIHIPENILEKNKADIYSQHQVTLSVSSNVNMQLSDHIEELRFSEIVKKTQIPDLAERIKKSRAKLLLSTIQLQEDGKEKKVMGELLFGVGIFIAFVIYMIIFLYGTQVMRGVMEEKSSRIVEVIISSVQPFKLMLGKIIGIAMVCLTQIIIWIVATSLIISIISAVFLPQISKQMDKEKLAEITTQANVPDELLQLNKDSQMSEFVHTAMDTFDAQTIISLLLAFVFFGIFGYLLYAALFAAIGSAVDSETDTQQFILPVSIPLMLAFYIAFGVARNPESSIASWSSMIPFTSPIVMPVRMAYGVPLWEIILSAVLLIIGFLGIVWLSAKIYRTGILMYGKKVSYKEIWKWIRYKN